MVGGIVNLYGDFDLWFFEFIDGCWILECFGVYELFVCD